MIPKNILNEMDKADKYRKKHIESVSKIEDYFKKQGFLRDGANRGIYINGEYICDMSFFEDGSGLNSESFLKLLNQ